jgi:hypothetical protein
VPDPDLHLIAFAKLAESLGRLAVLVRELDEFQHMGGMVGSFQTPNIDLGLSNCNI